MSKAMKIILAVVAILALACGAFAWYVIGSMRQGTVGTVQAPEGQMDLTEQTTPEPSVITFEGGVVTTAPTEMPIYEEAEIEHEIVNIMLIGSDARNVLDVNDGRSDSMMLASLNLEDASLTLISFMRDAYVKRIGESGRFTFYNRLNGAFRGGYGGGGAGELINTVNGNFNLDVQEYVLISFEGFATLIDKIGGIDVELDQAEINFINDRIGDGHEFEPQIVKDGKKLRDAKPGMVHLDGTQALVHARNRHTGFGGNDTGDDFDRVSRQQQVIQIAYKKIVSEMSEQNILALISFATQYVKTNMKLETMIGLARAVLKVDDLAFKSLTIPQDGSYKLFVNEKGEKTDMLEFNIKKATTLIHETIYGPDGTAEPEED